MMRRFRNYPQIGGANARPYDAELKYLESISVGNESTMPVTYIDTGIECASPITVTVDCEFVTLKRNSIIFGSRSSTDGRLQFGTGGNNSGTSAVQMAIGYGTLENMSFLPTDGFHEYVVEFGNPTRVLYDGEIKLSITKKLFSNALTMWMFASNAFNGVYGASSEIRIRSFKVKRNGVVIFDAIPVRFTNELGISEGAMYDRRGDGGMNQDGSARNDGIYRNRGTGAFVIGPDKQPR